MTDFAAARRIWWTGRSAPPTSPICASSPPCEEIPRERFVPPASVGACLSRFRSAGRRQRTPPAQADGARQAACRPPISRRPTTCSMPAAPPATARRCWRRSPATWWRWKRTRSLPGARVRRSPASANVTVGDRPARRPAGDKAAPYDAIVLEGATEVVPQALCAQLKDGGRLVCVLGVRARRQGHALSPQRRGFRRPAAVRCRRAAACRASPNSRFSPSKYHRKSLKRGKKSPTSEHSVGGTPARGFKPLVGPPMVAGSAWRVCASSRSAFRVGLWNVAFASSQLVGWCRGRCARIGGRVAVCGAIAGARGHARSRRWCRPIRTTRR